MPRLIAITSAFLLSLCGLAQTSPSKPATPTRKPSVQNPSDEQKAALRQLAVDLLERSHALNDQVDAKQHMQLLPAQISVVSRLDKKLARAWAQELFDLGTQRQVQFSALAQSLAINVIAKSDPDGASELLAQIDPSSIAFSAMNDLQGASFAVRMPEALFTAIAARDGTKAMPRILDIANSLGEKGRYPFAGVMAAAVETHDEAVIDQTAKQLLDRFQKRIDPPSTAFDFAVMLKQSEGQWPSDLLKPSLESVVDALQHYPLDDESKELEAQYTTADATATVHGPVEIGMMRIAPIAEKTDPELWKKVLEQYPNLSSGPMADIQKHGGKMTFCPSGCDAPSADPQETKRSALDEIRILAWTDGVKTEKAISTITDPATRAEALVIAAQAMMRSDPQKSAEFSAEAERAVAQIKDPELQFKSACARLQSDALNNRNAAIPDDLDTAFQLADKVFRKRRDEKKDTQGLIGPLVEAAHDAVKLEPELTVAHIEPIYLPYERAQLLTAAASALLGPAVNDKPKAALGTHP